MFAFRTFFVLSAAAVAVANPLSRRQATNTNPAIHDVVSTLDGVVHSVMPTLLLQQANHTASDGTVGTDVNTLSTAFINAQSALAAIPVSGGSTTVTPTNDDISILVADLISIVASGFSGLTTATVPTFASTLGRLDPLVAATLIQFNVTLPGGITLVHTMMLDAQQFFATEGTWPQTLAALGF